LNIYFSCKRNSRALLLRVVIVHTLID